MPYRFLPIVQEPPLPPAAAGEEAVWGSISGTLSEQLDLVSALDGKSSTTHTHTYVKEWAGETIDDTLTEIMLTDDTRLTLSNDETLFCRIDITAADVSGNKLAISAECLIVRGAAEANTEIKIFNARNIFKDIELWTVQITADTINGALALKVQGAAKWKAVGFINSMTI